LAGALRGLGHKAQPDDPVRQNSTTRACKEQVCTTERRQGTGQVPLPVFTDSISDAEMDRFVDNATTASNFLKALSHEGRLLILCHLVSGEKSVTELEELLSARQAAVSQQLSRLRLEGLVVPRRDGKAIYYRLADERPKRILELVYELFCVDESGTRI
jgi:DNA-binding transcriptional ArsR family regulator